MVCTIHMSIMINYVRNSSSGGTGDKLPSQNSFPSLSFPLLNFMCYIYTQLCLPSPKYLLLDETLYAQIEPFPNVYIINIIALTATVADCYRLHNLLACMHVAMTVYLWKHWTCLIILSIMKNNNC